MRHRKVSQRFGRRTDQRKALFKSLAISVIKHEAIETTLPKAKAVRGFIESLITLAKQDTVSKRRLAFARLRNKEAVAKLFTVLGPRFKMRPGGYLRVLKSGFRKGDAAPVAFLELVERS